MRKELPLKLLATLSASPIVVTDTSTHAAGGYPSAARRPSPSAPGANVAVPPIAAAARPDDDEDDLDDDSDIDEHPLRH